jgi:hypothetical protein
MGKRVEAAGWMMMDGNTVVEEVAAIGWLTLRSICPVLGGEAAIAWGAIKVSTSPTTTINEAACEKWRDMTSLLFWLMWQNVRPSGLSWAG